MSSSFSSPPSPPSPSAIFTYRPDSYASLDVLGTSATSIVQLQSIFLSVPTADHERAVIVFALRRSTSPPQSRRCSGAARFVFRLAQIRRGSLRCSSSRGSTFRTTKSQGCSLSCASLGGWVRRIRLLTTLRGNKSSHHCIRAAGTDKRQVDLEFSISSISLRCPCSLFPSSVSCHYSRYRCLSTCFW